jgi:hypothetical protein
MGVQTLKYGAFLVAGLVGAVLLIQGTGSVLTVPGSAAGGITFAASDSSAAPGTETSLPLALTGTSAPRTATRTAPPSGATTSETTSSAATSSKPASLKPASSGNAVTLARTTSAAAASSDGAVPEAHTQISDWSSAPTSTCPAAISGTTAGAPSDVSVNSIPGTNSDDMNSFATEYNAIRVANCLKPVPFANIRFSTCLEQRLFWMADDPSSNPYSAWGHTGTAKRSDGLPIVGCDGDLAGGSGYTGAMVADAWWDSSDHRASLYQPSFTGSTANVCIYFALTHGGYNNPGPNEPYSFTRAAAYWGSC